MTATTRERTLTEMDHTRLSRLLRSHTLAARKNHPIEDVLDAALLVPSPDVAPDVVTMDSQVVLALPNGERKTLTLCYPDVAEPSQGFVSVLSPVGSSLLGLRVGEHARWRTPAGDASSAEVLAILFQPEASRFCTA